SRLSRSLWMAAQPSASPGETVRLSCRGFGFKFGNSTVWWYRQAAGGSLEWVSYKSSDSTVVEFGQSVNGRATLMWDSSWSELYLSLRDLQPRDSARYFCAVARGQEIQLSFNTNLLGPGPQCQSSGARGCLGSDSQVIVMKSKNLERDGSIGRAACLAKNFNTKTISLEMSSNEVVYEQSTSILTSVGLYDTIKVVNVTKDTELTCTAQFNGITITANTTLPGTILWYNSDTKVEKANMLSVTVLGLRVLLAKSIAFNTLMSIKLFLF
uniref:Ig-like domain-containing protein n=1 Tax=Aquila chrysaetos chrysaetos TaxID=223781 RepID=A0A663DMT6_AQUCH